MAVTLLAFAAGNATAAEPKRVLLLRSFGPNFQAEDAFAGYLRTDLAEKSAYPIDRYEVSLEIARFTDGERDEVFAGYLRGLFAGHPPDLIVTLVSPAARFIQRHRRDLFPSTPVIFAGLDARTIKDATLTANDTMVAVSIDLNAVIENILRTLPNTTTLAVVIGNTPIEKFWVNEFLHAFQPFEGRVKSVFMNDLSFSEIQKHVAALPPASAIYFGYLVVDAQGVPYRQEEVLARLHAVANAPIFGQYDYQLGGGIVGGPLLSVRTLSRKTAEVAAQILGGRRLAISRPRRKNLASLSLTGESCGDGGSPTLICRPTALSGSASRPYGSNTSGTSLQRRVSPGLARSLSPVC